MGKYNKFERRTPAQSTRRKMHPIWRGIGCIMLILIPIMAWAGATLLLEANNTQGWIWLPYELTMTVYIPFVNISVPGLYGQLVAWVLVMIMGFGLFTLVYTLMYKVAGPPQYGPMDVPPIRAKKKKRY